MQFSGPSKMVKVLVLALSTVMFMSFLVPGQTAEASAFSGSPCPHYSIQDVFDDPTGNWDHDLVNNADELYNGLNPCIVDTTNFCANGGNALCLYPSYYYVTYATPCQRAVEGNANGDFDGDGISNANEVRNGADPCTHPCPYPNSIDVALNPNGSWDNDGVSNAIEVADGTNPCDGYIYNPCPRYSLYQIDYMPGHDWDRDGVTNSVERQRGTNPCVFNSVTIQPHVAKPAPKRLPHVTSQPTKVYIAPKLPAPVCPSNYPYFHPGNGLCYANPVGYSYWY